MTTAVMKVEIEAETCCVCGSGGELLTPEEHDAGASPAQVPLRSMLLQLNNNKVLPDGRFCTSCVRRAVEAYEFSNSLSSRSVPPLSEKIRALRRRLHELTQKIDVFIVVGGAGAGAGNAYNEDDIIMVERDALAAATAADDEDLERARNARGDTVYQCSVCPLSFQRVAEFRSHAATHGAAALHSCWTCGAQFATRQALRDHARAHDSPALDLRCHLCGLTFQSASELRAHESSDGADEAATCAGARACPACGAASGGRAELRAHVAAAHAHALAPPPLACAACFRTFPAHHLLAAHALAHRRAHAAARAHCYVCGYDGCILRFGTRSNLMSHIRKCHSSGVGEGESGEGEGEGSRREGAAEGGAPAELAPPSVPCDRCDRTFGSVAAMKRHWRVHRRQEAAGGAEPGEGEGEGLEGLEGEVEYLEVDALDERYEQ